MAKQKSKSPPARRGRFAKTREDHASETFDDYAEAIDDTCLRSGVCRVRDLAECMRVSHVTVVKIVNRMVAHGVARKQLHGPIELTPSGIRIAHAARQRHAIVLAFLCALGIPRSAALRDAEGIEHHVSAQTLRAMRRFLGRS